MITEDWNTKGFSLTQQEDIATLLSMALTGAIWCPYRDIEKLMETSTVSMILDAVAQEVALRFNPAAQISRREVWRGSIGAAGTYHSDLEDETNDAVAIICLTDAPQHPIDFMDKVTGETMRYLPKFGDVLLINNRHPTALHRGPLTNGPTDQFIIGQVSMICNAWT